MTNLEKIKTMFEYQNKFNNDTNGVEWVNGSTKEGRDIDWGLAIRMECAELLDCWNWKWWKSLDVKLDKENVVMEITDIWHFVMSLVIVKTKNDIRIAIDDCVILTETLLPTGYNISEDIPINDVDILTT